MSIQPHDFELVFTRQGWTFYSRYLDGRRYLRVAGFWSRLEMRDLVYRLRKLRNSRRAMSLITRVWVYIKEDDPFVRDVLEAHIEHLVFGWETYVVYQEGELDDGIPA